MTTISNLAKDLVEDILSRVPITCLGAVRSTCKRWNALSRKSILCKAEAKHQFMGFMVKRDKLCSLRFNLFYNKDEEFVDQSLKEISNNRLNQVKISKVFHCDGLLLCVTKEDNTRLVVWNPYLGQTRWIQPRNSYNIADMYAVGYDNNRKHKILRFLERHDISTWQHILECEIYDFSSNSWRVLDINTPTWKIEYFHHRCASLKGNTYFFANKKIVDEEDGDCLLCFDFTTESFGKFLPLPIVHYLGDVGGLSSIGGEKLAVLSQPDGISEVEIWVTTTIEPNAVSWSPFLKFDMEPHCGDDDFQFHYNGGSFFIDKEKKLAVILDFDKSKMACYEGAAYIIGENGSYVQSLVQIKENCTIQKGKRRREQEEANQQVQRRRLSIN
ncbi:PREDICTED: putative F-box protein At3g20030 [Camelina sativa]|uniref:F-box protein At3g20030 n=1 Tax=Camelina sativa TaxID=90675 RepID=A0ABM0TD32_CAMSA|nr:PREDICTED: putative F-box protein At3g20030 [Camelina sativa]